MANTLGVYNPIFYAQEALIQLEKALGMASRVHLGYDEERRTFQRGETISIRKPSTFTAQDAPSSAQDLDTGTVNVTLDYWREVKFALTDKELAFTGNRIIDEHIRPAAYTLADDIDTKMSDLYKDVPWEFDAAASVTPTDLTATREIMFGNAVPLRDGPGRNHIMLDGAAEKSLLDDSAFSQQQGAGDTGVTTQRTGTLGNKYGYEVFANQNTPSHTAGALGGTPLLVGAHTKGATSISVDGADASGTVKAGDHFVIAGDTQRYAVTADATATTGAITIAITPALAANYADDAALTVDQDAGAKPTCLAFHRNAFALVTAPLSELGNQLGANIATVQDPVTGLALRSRMYYVGNSSAVHVALDVLYGVKTLDGNLACRMRHD